MHVVTDGTGLPPSWRGQPVVIVVSPAIFDHYVSQIRYIRRLSSFGETTDIDEQSRDIIDSCALASEVDLRCLFELWLRLRHKAED